MGGNAIGPQCTTDPSSNHFCRIIRPVVLSSSAELTTDTHRADGRQNRWCFLRYKAGGFADSRRERPALLLQNPPSDEGSWPRLGPTESAVSQGPLPASRDSASESMRRIWWRTEAWKAKTHEVERARPR